MKTAVYFCLLLTGLVACHGKETEPNCGCEGPPTGRIHNVLGIYRNRSIATMDSAYRFRGLYLLSCNADFEKGKVSDGDTVLLSGISYVLCPSGIESFPLVNEELLELTAIRKK